MLTALALAAAAAWLALLAAPPWPWRHRHLVAPLAGADHDLGDVCVLIPARDEAALLPCTLAALARQGRGLQVVLVDDGSRDGSAALARAAWPDGLTVIEAPPVPAGWSGKVWAQHQGEARLQRSLVLLLDADIELAPGMVAALRERLVSESLDLVSVMARLPVVSPWERLLVPPFIYFFKLLYPFALSNRPRSQVAAAAGGCILLRREALDRAGGFAALRGALIDDCALARAVKRSGGRTWIGQSAGVHGRRASRGLSPLWDMVARTAYTQLGCSPAMLAACTLAMLAAFAVPVAAVVAGDAQAAAAGAVALLAMCASFAPTVRYLGLGAGWAATLPVAAALFLAMTWSSALRYWRGERSRWRGRRYLRAGHGA